MDRDTVEDLRLLAVASGLFIFWLRFRHRLRRLTGPPSQTDIVLRQAMRVEREDPVAAERLLDDHFRKEAEAEEQAIEALRSQATTDLGAAMRLYEMLQERLDTDSYARKEVLRSLPEAHRATALAQIDESQRQLRDELSRLDNTIQRLRER